MADLSVEFAGLKLPSPLFVGSGPNTRKAKESIAALKAGAGMLEYGFLGGKPSHEYERGIDQMWILPSKRDAFQNRFFGYASTGFRRKWHQKAGSLEYKMEVLSEIKKATKGLGAVVSSIGLVNYRYRPEAGFLRWGEMAKYSEEAGADAVILHLQTGQELAGKILTEDQDYLRDIIREVKNSCHIPVIAKLPIEGCDPTFLSALALNFGADAVAPTARYVGLHIDLDTGTVPEWEGFHGYGGPWALPITQAWMARIRKCGVEGPVIPGGGVMSWEDVARLILLGATMVQVCTWPILKGYEAMGRSLKSLRSWMDENGYETLSDFRGKSLPKIKQPRDIWRRLYEKGPYEGIRVNPETCNGCGACVHPCYFDAISVGDDRKAHVNPENCVGCGHCYQVCPIDAIQLPEQMNQPVGMTEDVGGRDAKWFYKMKLLEKD